MFPGFLAITAMAKRIRTRSKDEYLDMLDEDAPSSRRPSPRRKTSALRWLVTRAIVVLVLVGLLVGFAPMIVVSTGLWKTVLARAVPELSSQLEIGSLSLNWFSPVVVRNIRVKDFDGNPMAEVESVSTKFSLISLALQPSNPGKITVENAKARVVLTSKGSNWEAFMAKALPEQPEQPQTASTSPDVQLELKGASVEFIEEATNRAWLASDLQGLVSWTGSAGKPREANISGSVVELDEAGKPIGAPGSIEGQLAWTASATGMGTGEVQTNLQGFPLEISQPILRHYLNMDVVPSGALTADMAYRWNNDMADQVLQVKNISSPGVAVSSQQYLAGDRLQTAIQGVQGEVELATSGVRVNKFKLQSDLATISGEGTCKLADMSAAGIASALQSGDDNNELFISGEADVARIAAQLPHMLRLRPDTQFTSGVIKMAVQSTAQLGVRRLEGTLKAENLSAVAAGRRVSWEQPIEVTAVVSQGKDGPRIDDVRCNSSFLEVEGKGTLAKGAITATGSLDKLAAELGQFIDFGDARMMGQLRADLTWGEEQGRLQAEATARVQNFELQGIAARPWRESDLQVSAGIVAPWNDGSITQLEGGGLQVVAGNDKLTVDLVEGIMLKGADTSAPVKFELVGELENWMARAQSFVALNQWQMRGAIDAKGHAQLAMKRTSFEDVKLQLQQFIAAGPGLLIRESRVEVNASGVLDQTDSSFTSPTSTIACSSFAARMDDVRVQWGEGNAAVTGKMDYRGNVAAISGWFNDPKTPATQRMAGMMSGHLEAEIQNGVVQALMESSIENLAMEKLVTPAGKNPIAQTSTAAAANAQRPVWQQVWVEPKVELGGKAVYDPAKDSLSLNSASVAANAIQLSASGTIQQLLTQGNTDLRGELAYDLADVTGKLRTYLGETFEMVGAETRQFAIRGPLYGIAKSADASQQAAGGFVPNELSGELGIGWQSLQYVGLTTGAANLDAKLEKGVVQVQPFQLAMAEGKFNAAPQLYINEPGMPLVLGAGPLIEQMRISPELCQTWLKYVAPLIADATRAEGKFSVELQGAEMPLMDPMKMSVEGKLLVHEAKIGPGPLASPYISMAQNIKSLMEKNPLGATTTTETQTQPLALQIPEQNINVKVVDGRVYHQGLKMTIKDVVVMTEGSVGLDQTVEMVAIVPILDKWVEKDKYLSALKGQSIRIPVRGTLAAPRLDMRGLQDFSKTMISTAAKGALQNEIGKGVTKGQDFLQGELTKGQNALQEKIQGGSNMIDEKLKAGEEKVQQELNKGLKKLFGG